MKEDIVYYLYDSCMKKNDMDYLLSYNDSRMKVRWKKDMFSGICDPTH